MQVDNNTLFHVKWWMNVRHSYFDLKKSLAGHQM